MSVTLPDDEKLVRRLNDDDAEAFDLLYFKYSGRLFSFGMKLLKSKEETEELIQTVFLKIWENRHSLNKELCFRSYIFTILYNDICKLFLKKIKQEKYLREAIIRNNHCSSADEEKIENLSTLERVQDIINKMPVRQRIIFVKSRFDGKTSKEIAEELGLTKGTVENYISGSLKIIRESFIREKLY